MVNSSASHMAISSDASGLLSFGWKSARSVSSTTLSVSTSSASLVSDAISPRSAPEATDAGYSLAKLRRPRMGRACQATAEGADRVRRRLLGRRIGLEYSHHLRGGKVEARGQLGQLREHGSMPQGFV
jgi:hypothetical protein